MVSSHQADNTVLPLSEQPFLLGLGTAEQALVLSPAVDNLMPVHSKQMWGRRVMRLIATLLCDPPDGWVSR